MGSPLRIDLFAEDRAHEALVVPLVRRVAREEGRPVEVQVRAARGGHGRVLEELSLYQKAARPPELLVVAIDANCRSHSKARKLVTSRLVAPFAARAAIACPDPHIERWYLADPEAFRDAVGGDPPAPQDKCQRDLYKRALAQAVVAAGHPVMLGGIEFAEEIIAALNLYRAGRADSSLKHFVSDLRCLLKR